MKREHDDQSKLSDFETRLRSLAPRPPLAAAALVEMPDDSKQIADRQRWWSAEAPATYAFYRTVGLSASFGALFGAVCTLLILNWSRVPAPHHTPSVAVVADKVPHSNLSPNGKSPSNVATVTEHSHDSAGVSGVGTNRAQVEMQPQITSVRRHMNAELPHDWMEELRRLKPGTLGVGSLLGSPQSVRPRFTMKEPTFELEELSGDESPESLAESSNGSSRIDLNSAPLPQRAWMRQMLTSPNKFY